MARGTLVEIPPAHFRIVATPAGSKNSHFDDANVFSSVQDPARLSAGDVKKTHAQTSKKNAISGGEHSNLIRKVKRTIKQAETLVRARGEQARKLQRYIDQHKLLF
jgi:hypothetical protein